MGEISNFTECEIDISDINPNDLSELEELIWIAVNEDEQAFIDVASVFSNFYGDVGSEFMSKWNRS